MARGADDVPSKVVGGEDSGDVCLNCALDDGFII